MKGYAESQDVSIAIDGTYMGMAVSESVFKITTEHLYGDVKPAIIPVVYIVPFLVLFTLLVIGCIVLCWHGHHNSLEYDSDCIFQETLNVIESDSGLQANLVAAISLCCCTTIAIFIVDCISWGVEKSAKLPSYFPKDGYGLLTISVVFSISSLLTLIAGLVGFIILLLYWKIKKHDIKSSFFFIPILLCFGSTLLMISFHFQTILMAWSSDPFYASRIALYYGIAIFCLFISIKFAYNVSLTKNIYVQICVRIGSVVVMFIFVAGSIVTVLIFVAAIPVNNSIEQSSEGITSIYNGAVVLIGSIIAYKVGWHYFGNSVSVEDALKQAMAKVNIAPFYCDENICWEKLPEEKRMTEILKALIHSQLLTGCNTIQYNAITITIPSALNTILMKTCKIQELTTVQAATLTTSLAPHFYNAVENEKGYARITALIVAMYTIVLDDPNINLTILPSDEKKKTLEKEIKEILKDINESTTSLDEDKKKSLKEALERALTPYN